MRSLWLSFCLMCALLLSTVSVAQERGASGAATSPSATSGVPSITGPANSGPGTGAGPSAVPGRTTPAVPGQATAPGSEPASKPSVTTKPAGKEVPSGSKESADALERSRAAERAQREKAEQEKAAENKTQVPDQAIATPRNEFQDFIGQSLGRTLPMYGYDLFSGVPSTFAPGDRIPVTSDYVIGPGDEIIIRAWGQIDIDYRVVVDRNGNISIPKVGTINVAGIKYQDLNSYLKSAIGRIYRNFELNAAMGELRSIQILVVGQAQRPGTYTVSSLSTLVNALFASGGPSVKGSMRRIQLKRGNDVVTEFDLYDLLAKGDKSKDVRLLPGDVIYIPPIGRLVAISGSVNTPAIFELKAQTTLGDLIALAGGLTTTAAGQKVTVERIVDRRIRQVDEFQLDQAGLAKSLQDGDLISVFAISARFDNAVRLQGNVASPAPYPWREGMRVTDLLVDKNALIPSAYWGRQNQGLINSRYNKREINWDYAVVQRLQLDDLTTRLHAFNLGKAIRGDPQENMLLTPGDVVTVYAAEDALPKTENDVSLRGSIIGVTQRFVWRQGMRIRDLIPDARWLIDYYDYWSNLKGSGLKSDINWDYANLVRLQPSDLSKTVIPFDLGKAVLEKDAQNNVLLRPGDEITIFTKDDLQVAVSKQAAYVQAEGELNRAGLYRVERGETLRQFVVRIGGLAPNAYLFGAEFARESVRITQQKRLDEAIDRLEAEIQRNAANKTQSGLSTEDAASFSAQAQAQLALVAKLRQMKATGRIVLEVPAGASRLGDLPDLVLEDGDRFFVPAKPSTVGVMGTVYNASAYIYRPDKRLADYLAQAGGPTKDADIASLYVLRADGSVMSKRQAGLFTRFEGERLMPGDTIVVPEQLEKFKLSKELRDWSQIFYQFAIGVAGLKVLKGF